MCHRIFFSILVVFYAVQGQATDSIKGVASAFRNDSVEHQEKWNPVLAGALSAAIPGAGQVYTRHYFKAGSFLVLEGITAGFTGWWYQTSLSRYRVADDYRATADVSREISTIFRILEDNMRNTGDTALARLYADSAFFYEADARETEERSRLMRFEARNARYKAYNALSWMVGGYFFNIMAAVGSSHYFDSDSEKSSVKAAWFSAIPGLGLGQLYNGSMGKAGFIMMTQISLGVLAFNEHRLVNYAQEKIATVVDTAFLQDWEGRRSTAFRNRNQWLWYSIAFYFYGILDAIVDAQLHDYKQKIRAYPDLIPELSAIGLQVDYEF